MNTTYFKNQIISDIFKSTLYIGLSSTKPTIDGGNIREPPPETGYERGVLTAFSEPEDGIISNTTTIRFNESLSDWFPENSPAEYYLIFDAAIGGNLLMYDKFISPITIDMNMIVSIKPIGITIRLSD